MKFDRVQPWLTLLSRLLLGGVLLAAGALKVSHPDKSAMSVRAYELLPIPVANAFGYSLPWIEIGVGLLLLIGIAVRLNAIIGGVLMALSSLSHKRGRGDSRSTVVVSEVAARSIQRIRSIFKKS
jgi:uncharacterized membrane protein YphA (DoxX/SURF4 family)